jgi:hypothetical protein
LAAAESAPGSRRDTLGPEAEGIQPVGVLHGDSSWQLWLSAPERPGHKAITFRPASPLGEHCSLQLLFFRGGFGFSRQVLST